MDRWGDVARFFRADWEKRYAERGGSWSDYEPRYRYGWDRAQMSDYRGRSWREVEPDLRSEWEARYRDTPWEDAAPAVRHAWDAAGTGIRQA